MTVSDADAVPPVPPSVELTDPVVLVIAPGVELVTVTPIVQLLLAANVAPVRDTLLEPAAAVVVPLQVPVRPFGEAIVSPAGKGSLNAIADCEDVAGLVSVNVRLVVPPEAIDPAPNAFAIVIAAGVRKLRETMALSIAKVAVPEPCVAVALNEAVALVFVGVVADCSVEPFCEMFITAFNPVNAVRLPLPRAVLFESVVIPPVSVIVVVDGGVVVFNEAVTTA